LRKPPPNEYRHTWQWDELCTHVLSYQNFTTFVEFFDRNVLLLSSCWPITNQTFNEFQLLYLHECHMHTVFPAFVLKLRCVSYMRPTFPVPSVFAKTDISLVWISHGNNMKPRKAIQAMWQYNKLNVTAWIKWHYLQVHPWKD